MGVEEVEHIVNAHDGAYDGGNSVGHDIDSGNIQCHDGQKSRSEWSGRML